jgi:transposase
MVYTEQFIQQVVSEYQAGGVSAEALRKRHCIGGKNTVYRWLRVYASTESQVLPAATAPELQRALADAQLHIAYLETVLQIAQEKTGVDFKKKSAG